MPMRPDQNLVRYLKTADRIVCFTGAGISTGSGIPDYRGPQGIWQQRKPVYYQDFMTSASARIEYWDYKLAAWESFREAQPNAVHRAIAKLEAAGKLRMVVTQNIDGLHARAGTTADKLVELHGTNLLVECQSCGARSDPAPHFSYFKEKRLAPSCTTCGGFLKPATISFGQSLKQDDLERANRAAAETDLMLAMGSTLSVYPAASIPLLATRRGVPYIIINRGETDHDGHPDISLRLQADVVQVFPPAVDAALAG